jgi:hypothetical protein
VEVEAPDSQEINAAIGRIRGASRHGIDSPPRSRSWSPRRADRPGAEDRVEQALEHAHPVSLGRIRVEAVDARFHRSRIGHELARRARYGVPCGVVYRLIGTQVDVSIYSVDDFDVAKLAASFGGGGHRSAAGFTVTLDDWIRSFV